MNHWAISRWTCQKWGLTAQKKATSHRATGWVVSISSPKEDKCQLAINNTNNDFIVKPKTKAKGRTTGLFHVIKDF